MHRLRVLPAAGLVLAIILASALLLRHAVLPRVRLTPWTPSAGDTPGDAGLQWRECVIAGSETEAQQAGSCLGGPPPALDEQERSRLAESSNQGHRLHIGSDIYETTEHKLLLGMSYVYVLSRNGRPQQVLVGEFTAYSPDRSLQNIGGQAVWEFAAEGRATVIVDGADVRRLYGLDAAYAPYGLAGKLIFIGQKAGRRFVVYDGRQIGPAFDGILIAYCCEPAAYSARGGGGQYAFWGTRGGQRYVVEISVDQARLRRPACPPCSIRTLLYAHLHALTKSGG